MANRRGLSSKSVGRRALASPPSLTSRLRYVTLAHADYNGCAVTPAGNL